MEETFLKIAAKKVQYIFGVGDRTSAPFKNTYINASFIVDILPDIWYFAKEEFFAFLDNFSLLCFRWLLNTGCVWESVKRN